MSKERLASHAGSWYTRSASELSSELDSYLSAASPAQHSNIRLIIGPHAGYAYSGPTAAWAYKPILNSSAAYSTVFLLGPSHHSYFKGCSLPYSTTYATPIGSIPVNTEIIAQLQATEKFRTLTQREEEKEHSLEMHLPYIRKAFAGREISLVPIMVGEIGVKSAREYANIFAEFLRKNNCLFIISSDFCHWGDNFQYVPYDSSKGEIHEFIEHLDRFGIELIERHDLEGFNDYLRSTGNTICGRNPIMIALATIIASGLSITTSFIRYAQSNQVKRPREFSVSYASSISYLN